jgi:Domain of unknown function (DUF4139)
VFGASVPRPTPTVRGADGFDEVAEEPTRVIEAVTAPVGGAVAGQLEGGEDFDEDTAVRGAPAPPMSVPAPEARSRGLGARVAAAAAAPAALARSLGAKAQRKQSAPGAPASMMVAAPTAPAEGAGGPAARAVELEASPDMLRYGDLRMSPPSSRRRGRLALASQIELYMALLIEQRVEVHFDVLGTVTRARQRSLSVTLPPGCVLAWAQGYDYAYRAESRVDVPSDGDSHSLPLVERRADSQPLYVVVPRESSDVFRTASVTNPLDSPLLPGAVDVYLGGDFLLTSRIEFTPPRGVFSVGLGVEQGIKVARNTRYREESAGLMGGALLLRHQVHVELRSALRRPAPLEVRERIPVAREGDDDVQVSVMSTRPQWEDWQQDQARPSEALLRGGYRWRVTLEPGAREELRADYDIRIPAKQELTGGNRRED